MVVVVDAHEYALERPRGTLGVNSGDMNDSSQALGTDHPTRKGSPTQWGLKVTSRAGQYDYTGGLGSMEYPTGK